MAEPEPLNVQVARRMFHVEELHPDWYPVPVLGFYMPAGRLLEYSWDEKYCNAVMYANGVDESEGSARPLPSYADEMEFAWDVVRFVLDNGGEVQLRITPSSAAASIRRADGKGHSETTIPEVTETSFIPPNAAEAICKAFVALYPVLDDPDPDPDPDPDWEFLLPIKILTLWPRPGVMAVRAEGRYSKDTVIGVRVYRTATGEEVFSSRQVIQVDGTRSVQWVLPPDTYVIAQEYTAHIGQVK